MPAASCAAFRSTARHWLHGGRWISDDAASLILEWMRKFERTQEETRRDLHCLREDVNAPGRRATALEEQLALVNRRLDRMDEGIERIERRLDLVEG